MAVKRVILWLARSVGLFWLARRMTRRGLMIVGWHGVSLADEHRRFPDLFISPEEFRRRLQFLKRNYRVIGLDEALRQHALGIFEPHQVVLTFDDGFFNFMERAVPVLSEFGMTATVYMATEYVEEQLPVPNLLLRDAVLLTECQQVRLPSVCAGAPVPLRSRDDLVNLTRLLLDELKRLPADPRIRNAFVREVLTELRVDYDDLARRRVWHLLSTYEVRMLSERGFSFQNHTHHHCKVVDFPELIGDEVVRCRRVIEAATGNSPIHFCYPSGRWQREAWAPLRRSGVASAVVFGGGPNWPETPSLALRRVHSGESQTRLEFEFEMSNLRYLLVCLFRRAHVYVPREIHSGPDIGVKIAKDVR